MPVETLRRCRSPLCPVRGLVPFTTMPLLATYSAVRTPFELLPQAHRRGTIAAGSRLTKQARVPANQEMRGVGSSDGQQLIGVPSYFSFTPSLFLSWANLSRPDRLIMSCCLSVGSSFLAHQVTFPMVPRDVPNELNWKYLRLLGAGWKWPLPEP